MYIHSVQLIFTDVLHLAGSSCILLNVIWNEGRQDNNMGGPIAAVGFTENNKLSLLIRVEVRNPKSQYTPCTLVCDMVYPPPRTWQPPADLFMFIYKGFSCRYESLTCQIMHRARATGANDTQWMRKGCRFDVLCSSGESTGNVWGPSMPNDCNSEIFNICHMQGANRYSTCMGNYFLFQLLFIAS